MQSSAFDIWYARRLDTRPGIDSGLSAGMKVLGLLTTFSAQELRRQPHIADFRDVTIRHEGEFLKVELSDQSQKAVARVRTQVCRSSPTETV